ncbi:MAG: 3-oxoacyl-ACP synthase III family protein [Alphaproteobacteria bacterium]
MSANSRNAASAAITGWGHALPKALVTSESLEEVHGLSPGSLVASTGVKTRYIADRMGAESQLELGLRAARSALERADISAQSLDLIIAASAVPQQLIPGTAPLYQRGLGLPDAACQVLDVNTTCLSALSALDIAASFLETGRASRVLIVSSELATCALPWKTAPQVASLFGDGAAAWVVEPSESRGLVGAAFQSFPSAYEACQLPVGGTRNLPHDDSAHFLEQAFFQMTGDALFKLVRSHFTDFLDGFLDQVKWRRGDVDFFVPHQASPLSLLHMARAFQVRSHRYIDLTRTHGNQIAASIPTAFSHARQEGKIKDGSRVLMLGTSAGVQFGAVALIA